MKALFARAKKSAEFRYSRATAPRKHDALDALFETDQNRILDQIDGAIDRGLSWIVPQPDVSMSVLLCAMRTFEHTLDPRFAFGATKAEHYRKTLRDPALRVVLPDYDPDEAQYGHLPHVDDVRPYYPVELLMIDTVWADKRPQPDILDRLKAFEDNGFYGTTHIVVGGLILRENGGAPAQDVEDMMEATVPIIVQANNITNRADDIFAERAMVLQWLDHHELVRPAWMMQLVAAQMVDGGWQTHNMPPVGKSNQHTTIVALAALAEFLAQFRAHKP